MRIKLPYGSGNLEVSIPSGQVTVLEPRFIPGIADERAAFLDALRHPIGTPPLRQRLRPQERIALVIPDVTRPFPSHRLLPWLLEELEHIPADRFTLLIGNGSHRRCTDSEIKALLGESIASRCRVVNHCAAESSELRPAGKSTDGQTVYLNRAYLEADRRLILGFIEPHFMAGFSGGYKAVFPGIADIDSILRYHGAENIAHPQSTWGVLDGNPTQEWIRSAGALLPVDFCVNVTLNRDRAITGFFCGETLPAHQQGCAFSRQTAMVSVAKPFPLVISTNSGYPLDQNLYQTVKGMSAAAQIIEPQGLILMVSECRDGFPEHGNFKKLMHDYSSPSQLLDVILAPGFSLFDQWEAQLLAMIVQKARVSLFSQLPAEEVLRAFMEPVQNIEQRLQDELKNIGRNSAVAILPEGPMTIPYLSPD